MYKKVMRALQLKHKGRQQSEGHTRQSLHGRSSRVAFAGCLRHRLQFAMQAQGPHTECEEQQSENRSIQRYNVHKNRRTTVSQLKVLRFILSHTCSVSIVCVALRDSYLSVVVGLVGADDLDFDLCQ